MPSRIHKPLMDFLESEHQQVASLKGRWGTGKTYFWNDFISKVPSNLKKNGYSYVSLFGLKQLSDLRSRIAANLIHDNEEETSPSSRLLKSLSWAKSSFKKSNKLLPILKKSKIPYLGAAPFVVSYIEDQLLKNRLICIDDIERLEKSISPSSVLGFISQLKEEKGCKILLIYNEDELTEETTEVIDEYREKVVDIELCFAPSLSRNISLIWESQIPEHTRKVLETLELNNIRIMKRIQISHDYFENLFKVQYLHIWDELLKVLTTISAIHYGFSKILPIDSLNSDVFYNVFSSRNEEEIDPVKKDLITTLQSQLGYYPNELDPIVIAYLKNGYLVEGAFDEVLNRLNQQGNYSRIADEYSEVWQGYHKDFTCTQSEFIANAEACILKHGDEAPISSIGQLYVFLDELGHQSSDMDKILDASISRIVEASSRKTDISYSYPSIPSKIRSRIHQALQDKRDDRSITELMEALAGSDSWHSGDIVGLTRFNENDFHNWILTENSINTVHVLKNFMERFGGKDSEEKSVRSHVLEALKKIAQRSVMDKKRVERIAPELVTSE